MKTPQSLGPYQVRRRLGAGGMGEVFEAYDASLHRRVAVKWIRPEASHDVKVQLRFRREAQAAASLDHPSIVRIHHILELNEGDAIVMELVEGTNLARLLHPDRLDLDLVLELARELAAGLREAHAKGIVHRDFKADNIMVTEPGSAARVKILDFGLAKNLLPDAGMTLTTQNNVRGTSRTMSPEQVRGLDIDARSDLFSFGILLYEMLTAHSPFASQSTVQTLQNVCVLDPTPIADLRHGVPEELRELIDRLLEKDPSRRPQSSHEVLQVLESISIPEVSPEELLDDMAPGEPGLFLGETENQTVSQTLEQRAPLALLDDRENDEEPSAAARPTALGWKVFGVVLALLALGIFWIL